MSSNVVLVKTAVIGMVKTERRRRETGSNPVVMVVVERKVRMWGGRWAEESRKAEIK